ncbi:MAG: HDOD domain-containing protein [Desulfobacter sp.]|nr:MAG: HDOD domain-containing protein [Desulfobacter sp.]
MDVFLARQPIFTKSKKLFGYELLFRTGITNAFPDVDGDMATANLISNLFFPFEINQILGNKKGLINFTKQLILDNAPLLLPKDQFVIEVLEDIEPDENIISALSLFRKKGYNIALDDFVYHRKFDPMIQLSRIIKFDLRATPLDTLEGIIEDLRSNYSVKLLAEKVETHQEFKAAKAMGFHYFQGFFFAKPEVLSTRGISANHVTKLRLINEISNRELNIKKIRSFIRNDAPLSFKLLKYANSAFFNRRIPIDTVKDAVNYIGEDELRKFINVVVVSDLGNNKPNELVRLSIIRARMCESFKSVFKSKFSVEELFTLGLFSYMDALMDCPMENVLSHLSFSDKMKQALMGQDKEFSRMVDIISGFERGEWDTPIYKALAGSTIEKKLPELYADAIRMANAFYG